MKKVLLFVLSFVILGSSCVYAGTDEHPAPYVGTAEFERLKGLNGIWKGTSQMEGKEEEAIVEYDVTSNGSTVVEKLFPGTPHEMVTVYYDRKGKLSMTHYCGLGNQPQMNLVSSNENEMKFNFSKTSDIDPAKEAHMHSLILTFDGNNRLNHAWQYYQNGAEAGITNITLTRTSPN